MNKLISSERPISFLLLGLATAAGALLFVSQPAHAESRGECVTAVVDGPFMLPNGIIYPAGKLTLCDYREFSPVYNLHRISVGGSTVGLFRSKTRDAESTSLPSPQMMFRRDADGILELTGYAIPSSGKVLAYQLDSRETTWQAQERRPAGGSTAPLAAIVATTRGR